MAVESLAYMMRFAFLSLSTEATNKMNGKVGSASFRLPLTNGQKTFFRSFKTATSL
jgi:hypothetical protein